MNIGAEDLQSPPKGFELQQAVDGAERDIAEGNWIEESDMLLKLKRWAGTSSED